MSDPKGDPMSSPIAKNDAYKRIGVSESKPEPPPVPTPEKETP